MTLGISFRQKWTFVIFLPVHKIAYELGIVKFTHLRDEVNELSVEMKKTAPKGK